MVQGKQIRVYLVDGTSGGLLTAEIMNWTGHVIAAPRSDLASLLSREEVRRTGVYILIGDDPDSQSTSEKETTSECDFVNTHVRVMAVAKTFGIAYSY